MDQQTFPQDSIALMSAAVKIICVVKINRTIGRNQRLQEYIRTTKTEIFWINKTERDH